MTTHQAFIAQATHHLRDDFLPKLRRCLQELAGEEVWWRPNQNSNRVGNLLLHLEGNVRQWLIAGLGGAADQRKRQAEFDRREGIGQEVLMERLEAAVEEALTVIEGLPEDELLRTRRIQVYDVNGIEAIFHVVEHFSYHVGQVVYCTKMMRDLDLRFYDL